MSGLEEIPEDAAGFMIIGSKYDLSPQEAAVLQRYWARPNAAILIMLEPQNDTPKQLYRFLREQGLWYGIAGFFKYLESRTHKMHVRVYLSRFRRCV